MAVVVCDVVDPPEDEVEACVVELAADEEEVVEEEVVEEEGDGEPPESTT